MDGKNKDELMMQQQVTHQSSPTMTAIGKFSLPLVIITVLFITELKVPCNKTLLYFLPIY